MSRSKIREVGYYMHKFITNKMKKELTIPPFYFNCYDFFFLEGRPVSFAVHKFKFPLRKKRSFCPCNRVLNRSVIRLIPGS